MRFLPTSNTSRLHGDLAEVSISSIRIELGSEAIPIVRARFRLRARHTGDRRGLLVDFSSCPLVPLEIESNVIERVDLSGERLRDIVVLKLRQDLDTSWDEAELVAIMSWSDLPAHPALVDAKFLYAPEELPTVGARFNSLAPMIACMPIAVEGDTDRFLVGAVSSTLDRQFHQGGPFVQAICCTKLDSHCSAPAVEPVAVCVLSDSPDFRSSEAREPIVKQIREMSKYFSERLGVHPGLRIAIAVDSLPGALSLSGALLTAPSSWYPAAITEHASKEFQIARMLASVWWGAGCRVGGGQGIFVASGISFAMGLAWTRSHAPAPYFDANMSYFRERLVEGFRAKWSKPRPGERTIPIGIAIFDALVARETAVWDCLGQLAREYWGREAPEEVVISALESAGVEVADFQRKRFRR
jgi:hypothetical protein